MSTGDGRTPTATESHGRAPHGIAGVASGGLNPPTSLSLEGAFACWSITTGGHGLGASMGRIHAAARHLHAPVSASPFHPPSWRKTPSTTRSLINHRHKYTASIRYLVDTYSPARSIFLPSGAAPRPGRRSSKASSNSSVGVHPSVIRQRGPQGGKQRGITHLTVRQSPHGSNSPFSREPFGSFT